jgi:hypothetical protein
MSEDEKEEDYEGYKQYKQFINPDKLIDISYSFAPIKLAIDTLFRKCYDNEQTSVW